MKSTISSMALIALLFAAYPGFAEDAPKAATTKTQTFSGPTKEDREVMAKAHEKMATCLRSDKDWTDCRDEMHQECGAMGSRSCGMMGMGMGMGPGMMMRRGPRK